MKRWIVVVLALLLFALPVCADEPLDTSPEGELACQAALVIDLDTGDTLFELNPGVRMYPASTTKIMTLLLALESGVSLDTVVTIPQEVNATPAQSSIIPIYPGEQMTFRDLLYSFMLTSGNDGAIAISILVSGSEAAFCGLMNARAAQIGCTGTHFSNSHGYHDDNHFTTARDLALIATEAMKNDLFRDIISRPEYTMHTDQRGDVVVYSTDYMLNPASEFYYEGMLGIKTGSTSAAGQCFVGAAKRNGVTLLSIVLKSADKTSRWTDTRKLLDYGFSQYSEFSFSRMYGLAAGNLASLRVPNAAENDPDGGLLQVALANVSDGACSFYVYEKNQARVSEAVADFTARSSISLTRELVAPIYEGEVIGNITYTGENGESVTGLLVATRTVEARPEELSVRDVLPFVALWDNTAVKLAVIAVGLILLLAVVGGIRRKVRRARRRRQIYEARLRAMRRRETARSGYRNEPPQRDGYSAPQPRQGRYAANPPRRDGYDRRR